MTTSTFTTRSLSGQRVLVKGTDIDGVTGETVLDASQWEHIKLHQGTTQAQADFDAAVQEFFAPLTEAAEKASKALQPAELDPIGYVVMHEGEDATPGRPREVAKLSPDSIVLRILESGDTDRLVWVNDQLEVLATLPVVVANAGTPEVHEDNTSDEG